MSNTVYYYHAHTHREMAVLGKIQTPGANQPGTLSVQAVRQNSSVSMSNPVSPSV